jgi:VCBS repeat-containing protein
VIVTVTDGGGLTYQETFTITVNDLNDAPVITSNGGGDTANVNAAENQMAVTTVTYTDADVPADSISFSLSGADAGLFSISTGGVLTFNTAPDFDSPTDADGDGDYEVTVTVNDGNGGIDTQAITVSVTSSGNLVANDNSYALNEDGVLTTNAGNSLLNNDIDADGGGLTVNTTPVSGPANGALTLNSDGTFTYTPNADFNGSDAFTYEVTDASGDVAQANVTITINPVNDQPNAVSDSLNVIESIPSTVALTDLLANDQDVDLDVLSLVSFSQPANGFLVDNGDGTYTYTPIAGFIGLDSFTYTVADPSGAQATATVIVTVVADTITEDPDPPIIPDDDTGDDPPPAEEDDSGTPDDDPVVDDDNTLPGGDSGDGEEDFTIGSELQPYPVMIDLLGGESDQFGINVTDTDSVNADSAATPTKSFYNSVRYLSSAFDMQSANIQQLLLQQDAFVEALDTMKRDMVGSDATAATAGNDGIIIAQIVAGTGMVVSVGFLGWVLNGGALAASLLSVMPVWNNFDPLPLLAARRKKRERDEDSEKDADDTASNLQKLFTAAKDDEGDQQ